RRGGRGGGSRLYARSDHLQVTFPFAVWATHPASVNTVSPQRPAVPSTTRRPRSGSATFGGNAAPFTVTVTFSVPGVLPTSLTLARPEIAPCQVHVVRFTFQPVFVSLSYAPPGTVTSSRVADASATRTRTPVATGSGDAPPSGASRPVQVRPSSPGGVWSFVSASLPSCTVAAQPPPALSHASPIPSPSASRCWGSNTERQSSAASGSPSSSESGAPVRSTECTAARASRSKPASPPSPGLVVGDAVRRTYRAARRPASARSKASPPAPAGVTKSSTGTPTRSAIGVVDGTSGDGAPGSSALANTGYTPAQPA